MLLIITCYGGGFFLYAGLPQRPVRHQGPERYPRPHPHSLGGPPAWPDPLLLSWIKETTNSYSLTLQVFSALFVTSLLVMAVLKYKTRHGIAGQDAYWSARKASVK